MLILITTLASITSVFSTGVGMVQTNYNLRLKMIHLIAYKSI